MTKKNFGLYLKKILGFDGLAKADIIAIMIGCVIGWLAFFVFIKYFCIFGVFIMSLPMEISWSELADTWNEMHFLGLF